MYYFVSDIHLGGGTPQEAQLAEVRFNKWLDSVAESAKGIFICGDLFDFWFEYKRVVPKGFVRTLGRLTAFADRGVRVVLVVGNHDLWVRDYFEQECGMEVYTTAQMFDVAGQRVYVAHGDNLNVKKAPLLRLMNSGFRSKLVRTLFSSLIHPDLALKIGQWWSRSSRAKHKSEDIEGIERYVASLVEYASRIHSATPANYYIFGHLHTVSRTKIEDGAEVIFINDWSKNPHCAVMNDSGRVSIEEMHLN